MLYCFCYLHNLSHIPDDYGSDQNQAVTEKRSPHAQQSGKYKVVTLQRNA